jgi:hypothetical protein
MGDRSHLALCDLEPQDFRLQTLHKTVGYQYQEKSPLEKRSFLEASDTFEIVLYPIISGSLFANELIYQGLEKV